MKTFKQEYPGIRINTNGNQLAALYTGDHIIERESCDPEPLPIKLESVL